MRAEKLAWDWGSQSRRQLRTPHQDGNETRTFVHRERIPRKELARVGILVGVEEAVRFHEIGLVLLAEVMDPRGRREVVRPAVKIFV